MKPLEVRVPHGLERSEVHRRLDAAVDRARGEYGDKVGALEAHWEAEDRLAVRVVVMNMTFQGTIRIEAKELVATLKVPFMAMMFSAQIRKGIEEQLGALVGRPV